MSGDIETVIFRRSILAEGPLIMLLLVLTVGTVILTIEYDDAIQYFSVTVPDQLNLHIPIPIFVLLPLVVFFLIVYRLFDCRYVIGDEYVRATCGLLSLRKHDARVDYQDMRGIDIDRTLYERIVNVGDLKVGSASHSHLEVLLGGIYNPSYYRDLIEERRKKYTVGVIAAAQYELQHGLKHSAIE